MKQVIRRGLHEIIVDEVPDPVVLPNHVLVRPVFSLISSGTETASIHQEGVLRAVANNPGYLHKVWDVLKVQGPVRTFTEVRAKFSEYAVLGYSGAGVVVEKHDSVRDLEAGYRVAYGGEGTGHGETVLVGRNLVVKIPGEVPFEHACFATLGAIAMNAVRIAAIELGETVAVLGLGLVGQLVTQLASLQGARVLAVDLKPQRVELARELGAEYALVGGPPLAQEVEAITDAAGVDCVVIAAAAKSSAPCTLAVQMCRERGRIVDVGAVQLSFPWEEMYRKEIKFFMARAYGPGSYDPEYEKHGHKYPAAYVPWTESRNMAEFLRLLALERVRIQPLITHQFALEEAAKAYETILNPASASLAVLLQYPAAREPDAVAAYQPARKVWTKAAGNANSKLGVALVGAGNLARWEHLPNLKKISRAYLRGVHSSNGPRGKSYGLRFKAAYCTTDYGQILEDPEVQVVMIASRNPEHGHQALAAIRAGKHVFVEKPMALTEEECRALVEAVHATGLHLTVGFNRRFAPYYVQLKHQLARRTGPVVLNCRINSPGISGAYWMADPASGGAILGEACHFADLMFWLLESEPTEVSAYCLPTGRKDPVGENNMAASFRFADGSVANLTYCTVGSRTSGGERIEIFAPGIGATSEDFKRLSVHATVTRSRSRWFAEKGYLAQLRSFFEAIRAGKPPEVTVRDGARATAVCLRMLESARTGTPRAISLGGICNA